MAWVRDFYARSPPYSVYSDRALQLHAFQSRGDTSPVCCVLREDCPPRTHTTTLATTCRIPAVVLRRLFSGVCATDILDSRVGVGVHPTLVHFLDYPKNRVEFVGRLNTISDLAFSPFEDTLTAFSDDLFVLAVWPWITFGFREAVLSTRTRWVYWRGFLLSDSGLESCFNGTFSPRIMQRHKYLVLFALLWRIHVAEVFRVLLRDVGDDPDTNVSLIHGLVTKRQHDPIYVNPNARNGTHPTDYIPYSLHAQWLTTLCQFQDCHIPILTKMVESGSYHDNPTLLASFYPALSDSLCNEELPDMTPLLPFAGIWFEHGTKNNARSAAYAVAHFFLGKTNMQSCQTHSIIDLAYQYCNTIPNFALLFQHVLRASLSGNLAVSRNRLVLAARIRVESALTDPLRSTTSAANLIDVPREKKKHRQRKRKQQEEDGGECGPEEPNWLPWFRKHQYVMTFLMREWHVQVACDSSEFIHMAEQHVKVRQGAKLVRATNAAVRANLNRQCVRQTDPRSPLIWDSIDGGNTGGTDAGGEKTIIGFAHVQSRLAFVHLRHHGFIKLLWDKSKGVSNQPEGRVSLPSTVTLDHLQFAAWCFVTQRTSSVEPLSILKSMGVTEGGFSLLRDMQYVYYEYKCRPSRFQHWMRALYAHSKIDFGIVCRFLVYVRRFQSERVFYLPADEKAMHIIQQRRTISLSPIDATTSNLGTVYHCRVCNAWSTPVVSAGSRPDPHSFLAIVQKSIDCTRTKTYVLEEVGKIRVHTTCATPCYTDPYTGEVYCKNSNATHDDDNADIQKTESGFTYLRDYYDYELTRSHTCGAQGMQKIYMPGTLWPMGTGIIGMCYFCESVCKVRVENWTSYGINCGCRDIREHGDEHPSAIAYDRIYDL